jgi:uncharacterized protein (TIGR02118 family)
MIRRVSLLERRPDLTPDEFLRHWVDVHAVLAQDLPGLRGYRANMLREASPETRWTGLGELWFDSPEAAREAFSGPLAERLAVDLGEFVADRIAFNVDEHVILPPSVEPG